MRKPAALAAASRASFNAAMTAGTCSPLTEPYARLARMTATVPAVPMPRGQRALRSDDHRSMSWMKRYLGLMRYGPCPPRHAAPRDRPRANTSAPSLSAVERGILDHPLHQLVERDARMCCEFGHQRRFRHAGLRIHFEAHQSPRPLDAVVVAEVRTAHAPAAQRAMRRQR